MKKVKYIIISAFVLIFLSIAAYVLNKIPTSDPQTHAVSTQVVEKPAPPTVDELLKLVNEERAKNNVAPLTIDERLNQSAQRKADDMTSGGYFGHVNPTTGRHGYEFIAESGIRCHNSSENLSWANKSILTSKQTVNSWIASKPHHEAMIDSRYSLTGFAISGINVVEHFCEPL